jgi:limonene 1,2-monooxygenase
MQRDFELVEWLEHLGFAELWIGEHHSGGMQVYGSPELFIAAAAERTSRINIGAGVIPVPYHHPYMIADRILQLDHQTRGRAMFGFGPGMLIADSMMLGIPAEEQRARLVEGVDIIMRLIGGETITHESDWFRLKDASLQLSPYRNTRPHMAVAASRTPTGTRIAGRYGFGVLTPGAGDVNATWKVVEEAAAEYGQPASRDNLRCLVNFHLAETKADALKAVEFGLPEWMHYLDALNPKAYEDTVAKAGDDPAKIVAARGGLVGTPDEAVEFLDRLWEKSGPFGTVLMGGTNWMPFEATKRSYELMMRYVMPAFNRANKQRWQSYNWLHANRYEFSGANQEAVNQANAKGGKF